MGVGAYRTDQQAEELEAVGFVFDSRAAAEHCVDDLQIGLDARVYREVKRW